MTGSAAAGGGSLPPPAAHLLSSAQRTPGPGRIVWLASYPKSGNTWVRAIARALTNEPMLISVNSLGSGSQPHSVGGCLPSFGLDPRWLEFDEIDRARSTLVLRRSQGTDGPPLLCKTHERYRGGAPGREPLPESATRAAILIVRDPRDVACSYADFFAVTKADAVSAMGKDLLASRVSAAAARTDQPWGSWSQHALSWLDPGLPFPVHLVRYEDLRTDAVATLGPVLNAVGVSCSQEQLAAAVAGADFQRLADQESHRGFREAGQGGQFFRTGRSGRWRDELPAPLAENVVAAHGEVMRLLGYLPAAEATAAGTGSEVDARLAAAIPDSLGIEVTLGRVPEHLLGSQRPRPWVEVSDEAALVRLAGGPTLQVSRGRQATVDWEPAATELDGDPSWLVQGWAVTLAMLQRGLLVLHAAVVRVGGEVVAIAGHPGAGKSTTAMGLHGRGHQLLVDDVATIELTDGRAWVRPFRRNVHLRPDAAAQLGLDFAARPPMAGGRVKRAFPVPAPPEGLVALDRIVALRVAGGQAQLQQLSGAQRLSELLAHTTREGIAPAIIGQPRYFELVSALAASTPVWTLTRPRGTNSLAAVLDVIEAGQGSG